MPGLKRSAGADHILILFLTAKIEDMIGELLINNTYKIYKLCLLSSNISNCMEEKMAIHVDISKLTN